VSGRLTKTRKVPITIEPGDRLNDGGDVFVTNMTVSDTIGGKK
jgi:hypothetical protein